jgi:hypothetical protein
MIFAYLLTVHLLNKKERLQLGHTDLLKSSTVLQHPVTLWLMFSLLLSTTNTCINVFA